MHAKLKSWYCPDIPDLTNYIPSEFDNFHLLLRVMVGPEDSNGQDSFDVHICTPKWLLSQIKKNEVFFVRHFFIVLDYNFENVFTKIKSLIESCSGENWDKVAEKVSRIGFWEFEDYTDSEPPQ